MTKQMISSNLKKFNNQLHLSNNLHQLPAVILSVSQPAVILGVSRILDLSPNNNMSGDSMAGKSDLNSPKYFPSC